MKINDIKSFAGSLIDKGVQVPLLLVGSMGVGKSQIFAQLAKEKNMRIVDLRLAQMEACDLIGMPYRDEHNRTQWAQPGWWPNADENVLILLDELNRAPTDVRQAIFQLVLDRKLHTHTLPKGCFVFAAVNPDNGEYQVEALDKAMLRRFCVLTVTPDTDAWLAYAKGKVSDSLTEFISTNRGLLFTPEDFKVDVKPTPDSYRMLDEMLKTNVVPREHQSEIFRGLIGTEAATTLIKWLDAAFSKPVSGTEILTDYKKVQAKVKKQTTPENYNTITDLAACLTEKKTLLKPQTENLISFVLDVPKESQTAFLTKCPRSVRDTLILEPKIAKLLIDIVSQ